MGTQPQFVIAVRHGEYSSYDGKSQPLTSDGIEKITELAQKIFSITQDKTVAIFSSPLDRAVRSATIISEAINVKIEIEKSLSGDKVSDGKKSAGIIIEKLKAQERNADVIITIGHLGAPSGVIGGFSCKFLNQEISGFTINKGFAIILDLATGSYKMF